MGAVAIRNRFSLRDLSLFTKLLLPFFALLLLLGASGTFLVVRDISSRARAQLDQELLVQSLNARSRVHDRELYLAESADFAANLAEIAGALRTRDTQGGADLLTSVVALK